ncbi:HD-GYP domain-containing protein [Tautonia marina]|uniref:HD-GYP domain-containing protein n=1 Tax=Tautonia marina TaxID=2653855 RepID=UPI0012611E25|nr:HD-GYP domain-containing protein [Tautonia marina]
MHAGSTVDPFSIHLDAQQMVESPESQAQGLARALRLEFSAPVGLLSTDLNNQPLWLAQEGSDGVRWPEPSRAAGTAIDLDREQSGASLWLPGPAEDHLWLILHLTEIEEVFGKDLTVWVGFALVSFGERAANRTWGPATPAQALLAWGREVAQRLGKRRGSSAKAESSSLRSKRTQFRIPDRLTREMSIAEPPKRFQQLAVELMRETLQVEAVAWVPRSHREAVVIDGEVAGLSAEAYRVLLPSKSDQGERRWTDDAQDEIEGVRQALAISSDSEGVRAGWLVAVNPIDGRSLGQDEADVLRPVASLIATQRINARHFTELKDLLFGIIRSLTAAIDAKDPYTLGHSERVGRIASLLGEVLGLSANERGDLYLCGLLHDVGKIGIRDATLQKPGPLTPEEFQEIKRHPTIGVQILSDLKKLHHLLPGVAHHHENFDGSGYPDGLSGNQIPQIARILAVADAFDAMSSTRPYRRRLATEQIDRIFRDGAGTQWDPEVVDAMFACREQIESIRQKGLGQSVVQAVDDTINRNKNASYVADSVVDPPGFA